MSTIKVAAITSVGAVAIVMGILAITRTGYTQAPQSSYAPVRITETFAAIMERMKGQKNAVMQRQMDLLNARYDLSNRPAAGVSMSRGKPVQEGVRVKLPQGVSWQQLASTAAEEVKRRGMFPDGFMPLPHPNHPEGECCFRNSLSMRLNVRKVVT
jgi:hypothetical protein